MTPDDLRRALVQAEGEAVPACLATLDGHDGAVGPVSVGPGEVATANLLTIYRRRASHVEAVALPTLGFRETVARLEETPLVTLRLAGVEAAGGHPTHVVFLAPEEPVVLAVLSVLGPAPST